MKLNGNTDCAAVAAWQSPSNIAIVKYWGKRQGQLPVNPSVSLTLERSVTRTRVRSVPGSQAGLVSLNGDPGHPFLEKLRGFHTILAGELPILADLAFEIETANTFPHSTGIASSASGISAFTLCLLTIAGRMEGFAETDDRFFQVASRLSRLGSGSACRSVYGGFTLWGQTGSVPGSSDLQAVPLNSIVHPEMLELHDAILVISASAKELSSSRGHSAMERHPFLEGRKIQAGANTAETLGALRAGDFDRLALIAENEALTLHALMMSSSAGTILMKPATLQAISIVRAGRRAGLPLFFTLDAGANLHLLYPASAGHRIGHFIEDELKPLCENGQVIFDRCGSGPVMLDETSVRL